MIGVKKTIVELISIGLTSHWHNLMNVNDFSFLGHDKREYIIRVQRLWVCER